MLDNPKVLAIKMETLVVLEENPEDVKQNIAFISDHTE